MDDKKQLIICSNNRCGAEFMLLPDMICKRVIAELNGGTNKIEERYFRCPACGEHYTVTVTDRELRKRMKKAKTLADQIHSERNSAKRKRSFSKYQKLVEGSQTMSVGLKKSWKVTIDELNAKEQSDSL